MRCRCKRLPLFELLVRGEERPECPQCGSHQLDKQLSVPAAHTTGGHSLPVCDGSMSPTCGMPQCGGGRCALG
ncbi:MAG: DUF1178 family protein [Planctomycetes bacterium]|nr:DUF1178 family protein [Planctomycetota bacterium]